MQKKTNILDYLIFNLKLYGVLLGIFYEKRLFIIETIHFVRNKLKHTNKYY